MKISGKIKKFDKAKTTKRPGKSAGTATKKPADKTPPKTKDSVQIKGEKSDRKPGLSDVGGFLKNLGEGLGEQVGDILKRPDRKPGEKSPDGGKREPPRSDDKRPLPWPSTPSDGPNRPKPDNRKPLPWPIPGDKWDLPKPDDRQPLPWPNPGDRWELPKPDDKKPQPEGPRPLYQ